MAILSLKKRLGSTTVRISLITDGYCIFNICGTIAESSHHGLLTPAMSDLMYGGNVDRQ
jgi:hypothetical protein